MKTILIILIATITIQAQIPDTIPTFNHLPKHKKEFYYKILLQQLSNGFVYFL
jgi:hypothetical protein